MIRMHLTREELLEIYQDAKKAAMGGKSQIKSKEQRKDKGEVLMDQIVGMIGEYSIAKWKDGHPEAYRIARHYKNLDPEKGDGGYDLPRCKFDIKTSMMRKSQDPTRYRLSVRPDERHPGWTYGQALVPGFEIADLSQGIDVLLAGWALETDLPKEPNGTGKFEGAYTIPVPNLKPFTPLNYG